MEEVAGLGARGTVTAVTPDAATAHLRLADGTTVAVRLGVLDEDAEVAFLRGQCLALGVAVANATGWPLRVYHLPDHGEVVLHHVYAVTPTGALLDAGGTHSPTVAELRARPPVAPPGILAADVPADEAHHLLTRFRRLQPQDVEVAATFVPAVLARVQARAGHARGRGGRMPNPPLLAQCWSPTSHDDQEHPA